MARTKATDTGEELGATATASVEELLAEIEILRAELEAAQAPKHQQDKSGEDLVDFFLPMREKNDQPLFVGVNGQNICIRRGETVKIKRKYYNVLKMARDQEMAAYRAMRAIQSAGARSSGEM